MNREERESGNERQGGRVITEGKKSEYGTNFNKMNFAFSAILVPQFVACRISLRYFSLFFFFLVYLLRETFKKQINLM